MNIHFVTILFVLAMISCKESAPNSASAANTSDEKNIISAVVEEDQGSSFKVTPSDLNNQSRNMKLLQGLWENIDESSKRIEFKNTKKIEIMEDVQADEGTIFSITDKCEQSNINIQGESKGRFISVLSLNQCYYIAQLNGKSLHLGDMSSGKTLKYKKVTPN